MARGHKATEKIARVNTYLPQKMVDDIDALTTTLAKADPLQRPIARTDTIRLLLSEALARRGAAG